MDYQLKGSFEIQRAMQPPLDLAGLNVGRMRFTKTFQGDLTGDSVVEMMGIMLEGTGSGGYVALERLTGQVKGRGGSFLLQHSSSMERGKPTQQIHVIPDSGTGDLTGLSGAMTIDIVDGKHFYTCDFRLP